MSSHRAGGQYNSAIAGTAWRREVTLCHRGNIREGVLLPARALACQRRISGARRRGGGVASLRGRLAEARSMPGVMSRPHDEAGRSRAHARRAVTAAQPAWRGNNQGVMHRRGGEPAIGRRALL